MTHTRDVKAIIVDVMSISRATDPITAALKSIMTAAVPITRFGDPIT